ncbi:enoyl-CoA hydratase/isomerase family protein [Corynebacterium glyciniphilum]|uniref:enoyl-CoA hydratase/isomerase family protein n=1 Tax=Corynebacterium glyciniphilum TaxID=1404244 RepID=UPI00264E9424|nr:enoyl-CoA hydratase-related protein [Corynebacterium glyciniphilum]MDN6707132.1 enoyl-CoA hydratase-related protein [Corynebacterium glyciniphilum]
MPEHHDDSRPGHSTVTLSVTDAVAELVLDAPTKLNALTADDLGELRCLLDDATAQARRGEIRSLVLRGQGRGFCAGRDVTGTEPDNDDASGYLAALEPVLHVLEEFPAPTFAAVHGACLGVGLGLAIACDVVYLSEKAKIGSPFAALGATLDSGGHAFLLSRLGRHRTLDLIYTGELISGSQAVSEGLFSRALPDEQVLEFTRTAARKAAAGPTAAFLESKQLLSTIAEKSPGPRESLILESAAQVRLSHTPDYAEGFRSFQEKRQPVFTGKAHR